MPLHYSLHKGLLHVPILRKINPAHTTQPKFTMIPFNIDRTTAIRSFKSSHSPRLYDEKLVRIAILSCVLHALSVSCTITWWFSLPSANNTNYEASAHEMCHSCLYSIRPHHHHHYTLSLLSSAWLLLPTLTSADKFLVRMYYIVHELTVHTVMCFL